MPTLWVAHAAESVALVRRAIEAAWTTAGVSESETSNAVAVVSELVANSVRHAKPLPSGQLSVEWRVNERRWTIIVTDGGGGPIELQRPDEEQTQGRGLAIVAILTDEWGTLDKNGTNIVWAYRLIPTG